MVTKHTPRASTCAVVLALLAGAGSATRGDSATRPTAAAAADRQQSAGPPSQVHGRLVPSALRWGPPEAVAAIRESEFFDQGRVAVHGRRMMAVWDDPLTADPRTMGLRVSSRRADGRWTPPRTVARFRAQAVSEYDLVLGPQGSALLTYAFGDEFSHVLETHLRDGLWSRPRRLGGRTADSPSGVIDGRGVMTVTWSGQSGAAVARLRPGGRWGPVRDLTRFGYEPIVATNRRGDVAVAWGTDTGIGVAVRLRGQAWGRPRLLSSIFEAPELHRSQLAVGPDGRVLVMWSRSEEDSVGHTRRHLAWARSRHDGTWTRVRYLDTRKELVWGTEVRLSMNGRGRALAAWWSDTESGDGNSAARFRFGRGWTAPRRLGRACCAVSATLTRSGTAIAVLGRAADNSGTSWAYQHPGRRWHLRLLRSAENPAHAHGSGQRVGMLYYSPRLTARMLRVPSR